MWKLLTIGLCICLAGRAQAQLILEEDLEPRTAGTAFGAHIHSYGIGFDFYHFKQLQGRWEGVLFLSTGNIKDPKESRTKSLYNDQGGRDFIYDKRNYAYYLAGTYGLQTELLKLNHYNKLSLRAGLGLGPVFGILKPYYLEVAVPVSTTQAVVEIDQYDYRKYNFIDIVGRADYFVGLNRTQFVPGLRIKGHALLSLAGSTLYIRGVDMGFTADLYSRALDILHRQSDRSAFFSLYLGFLIGNAW